jgi:predicted transcriptional regulator
VIQLSCVAHRQKPLQAKCFLVRRNLRRLAEVAREIKCRRNGVYRLSDAARAAFREGIDAAEAGHFAPEDEMDEFYRLHRNP